VVRRGPGYIIAMLATAADFVSFATSALPPDVRTVVEAHFLDGDSIFKIQRRFGVKRRDVEAMIETALAEMGMAFRSHGVRGMTDVI
jgi:DNA-directed RNA polymerase specialized sigma24 family protein